MYKVFLADDEVVIREGIRTSFPWDTSGFALAGEAPDGEIALSLMQEIKPDILITDIRMPFMDGLELSRRALVSLPWLKIIVLSGFDEFTYAREALVLGVKEYLLKPVSAQELEQALRRIAGQIDEERRQYADLQAVKKQLELSSGLMKEQFLREVLNGIQDSEKRSNIFLHAKKLGMNLMARHYRVMLVSTRQSIGDEQVLAKAMINRVVESQPKDSVYLCQVDGVLALLFLNEQPDALEEHVFSFAEAVKQGAKDIGLPPMHIAIGAPVGAVFKAPDSLASAYVTLRAMSGYLNAEQTSIMDNGDTQLEMSDVISVAEDASLYERLRFASVLEVEDIVKAFLNKDIAVQRSLMMMNYLLVESLLTATRIVKENGGEPGDVLPEHLEGERGLSLLSEPDEVTGAAVDVLTRALAFRDKQSLSRYSEVIRQARAFIDQNFTDPNISLGDAAKSVHLSPNHFCTVFSQETGLTFIEYLTGMRMERARDMLGKTQMRSSDIAVEVGYRDPHYFSYLFKKHTGVSPRDYRRTQQADAT